MTSKRAASILVLLGAVSPAAAQFSGAYDVAAWTFLQEGANDDGSVDTSGAPAQVLLTGGDNNSSAEGYTRFTIPSQGSGLFSFTWDVEHPDPGFDFVGYTLGGQDHDLTAFSGDGSESLLICPGETLGFYVYTPDNELGAPTLTVTLFSGPDTDPWVNVGGGIPGTLGNPVFKFTGSLQPEALGATCSNGPPFGVVFGVFSLGVLDVPFKGGTLVPLPGPGTVFVLPLNGLGEISGQAPWPPGVPPGTNLAGQIWFPDGGAVLGFAASDGIVGTTP